MAKCQKCGRGGVGLIVPGMLFSDRKYVCFDCARELGFNPKEDYKSSFNLWSYEEIKDGLDAYNRRRWDKLNARDAASLGLSFTHWKQLKAAQATDLEFKLFSAMCAIWEDERCDASALSIAPGENGSLLVFLDDVVVLEYKGEPQVRWIFFPDSEKKVRIGNSARINGLADRLVSAYRSAE